MPNLYQDTAEPATPTPALDGDVRTDVVVIGGGITGLSTALHLAEQGAKVVLLEAEEPGWGIRPKWRSSQSGSQARSGRGGTQIRQRFGRPHERFRRRCTGVHLRSHQAPWHSL